MKIVSACLGHLAGKALSCLKVHSTWQISRGANFNCFGLQSSLSGLELFKTCMLALISCLPGRPGPIVYSGVIEPVRMSA
jgi:hypothetical protein